jgi:transposase InsO family protein
MADILKSQKPRLLQTDNGSEFIAGPFQALLRKYQVKHITGLAGRAFSQGSIERWNGTIKSIESVTGLQGYRAKNDVIICIFV